MLEKRRTHRGRKRGYESGVKKSNGIICTYFINIWNTLGVAQRIEYRVQFIQHFNNFHRTFSICIGCAVLGKANDSRKQQRYTIISVAIAARWCGVCMEWDKNSYQNADTMEICQFIVGAN